MKDNLKEIGSIITKNSSLKIGMIILFLSPMTIAGAVLYFYFSMMAPSFFEMGREVIENRERMHIIENTCEIKELQSANKVLAIEGRLDTLETSVDNVDSKTNMILCSIGNKFFCLSRDHEDAVKEKTIENIKSGKTVVLKMPKDSKDAI